MKEDITRFKFRRVEESDDVSQKKVRRRTKSLSEVKEVVEDDVVMQESMEEEQAEEVGEEEVAEMGSDAEM